MNKTQKLEYQQLLEAYMEKHQIYDLMQKLFMSLLQEKPEDPLDYLMSRLEKPQAKRIFIVGPPSCEKSKVAQELATEFDCVVISMKSVFEKQIAKKTDAGKRIEAAQAISSLVDDETVTKLLTKKLKKQDKKGKNVIISGFPINVVQALALQTNGIVPTKFFILKSSFEESYGKALKMIQSRPGDFDKEALAKRLVTEYYMYLTARS